MANANEIPRGHLSSIILSTLLDTDKYGYEIIDDVFKKTNGEMSIKQPSLYSSLKRMEEQALISSYWRDSDIGGKRHYYHLTDLGKKHLEKWQSNLTVANNEPQVKNESDNNTKFLQQDNMFASIQKEPVATETPATETVSTETINNDNFIQFDIFAKQNEESNPDNQQNTTPNFYNNFNKTNKSFSDSIKETTDYTESHYSEAPSPVQDPSPLINAETNINNLVNEETKEFPKINISQLEGYSFNTEECFTNANQTDNIDNTIPPETETKNQTQETAAQSQQTDDGIFITERIDIKDIPKNPKFEARRFEIYISDDTLSPKLKTNNSYEDRILALYQKSINNAENQELEVIEPKISFRDYNELQKFYSDQNIKFKPFKKSLYKSEKNFDMIKISKLNLFTSTCLLGLYSLISIILSLFLGPINDIRFNKPISYIIFPAILGFVTLIHLVLHQKSPQKRVAYDTNKFKLNKISLVISILIIPVIFAVNVLFGFNFKNFAAYSLTIIYPIFISLIYLFYYVIQKLLTKSKKMY